jgi:uncharacterized protein (TIGR00725 family)
VLEKVITVFGSSRPREGHEDYEEARLLGQSLAQSGFSVCTGGYGGVMEGVSRGASEAGGRVLAVTSQAFRSRANRWVSEERSMDTWQDRLFELVRLGDGYVACKGGTGTLAELAVVWEMLNKRALEPRPFVILGRFWQPVVEQVSEVEAVAGTEQASRSCIRPGLRPPLPNIWQHGGSERPCKTTQILKSRAYPKPLVRIKFLPAQLAFCRIRFIHS